MAEVVAVCLSAKKGTVKTPVSYGVLIEDYGLEGDAHAGKWHRQVSLLAEESIDKMRAMGVNGLWPGMFAENITTRGIVLYELPVGSRVQVGDCLLEITQIGKLCHGHCEIYKKVGMCIMPTEGVFAKVVMGGRVKAGDIIKIL